MRFFVTGSAGLVGRQVVLDLKQQNFEVYSAYHNVKPVNGIPIPLDLTEFQDISEILEKTNPDVIIHLAALTNVDQCETERDLATAINAKATEVIARQAAKQRTFLVYLSTDYVFDGSKGMIKEDEVPAPIGLYGKSKLEGEKSLQNLASSWCIARTSTPFGFHPKKKSFPSWVAQSLKEKKEIDIVVDQFTSPTYVPNLSRMLIEIATRQIVGVFHLAGSTRISRYELAELVANKLDLDKKLLRPISISQMSWKAKRPKDSSLDVSKAKMILNEQPQQLEQSLEHFINEISTK